MSVGKVWTLERFKHFPLRASLLKPRRMCPSGGGTERSPFLHRIRSYVSSLFSGRKQQPSQSSPASQGKRSREEAFSEAHADSPSAQAAPAYDSSKLAGPNGIESDDLLQHSKRPRFLARVHELKNDMHQASGSHALPMQPPAQPQPSIATAAMQHAQSSHAAAPETVQLLVSQQVTTQPAPPTARALEFSFGTPAPSQPGPSGRLIPQPQPGVHKQPQPTATAGGWQLSQTVLKDRGPTWAGRQLQSLNPSTSMTPGWGGSKQTAHEAASARPSQYLRSPSLVLRQPQPSPSPFRSKEFDEYQRKVLYFYNQRQAPLQPAPLRGLKELVDLTSSADRDIEEAEQLSQKRKAIQAKGQANAQDVQAQLRQLSVTGAAAAAARSALALSPEGSLIAARVQEGQLLEDVSHLSQTLEAKRAALRAGMARDAATAAQLREDRRQQQATAAAAAEAATRAAARERVPTAVKPKARRPVEEEEVVILSSDEEEVQDEEEAYGEGEEEEEGEEEGEEEEDEEGPLFGVTSVEEATWQHVFNGGPKHERLIDYKNYQIARAQLLCMAAGQWLNDEAINMYMVLLQERDTALRNRPLSKGSAPRCHFFNSFFLSKLYRDSEQYNYKAVSRWTTVKKLQSSGQASPNLLEVDRIIIPVNCGNVHWTCCMIDLQNETLAYYDSMNGKDAKLLENLARYIEDEARDKCGGRVLDTSKWTRSFNPPEVPRQTNHCDCGVFTIMFADRLGLDIPFDFNQSDMRNIRVKVLHRLINNKI